MSYGTQYSGLHHHHLFGNLELEGANASNLYNPYMVPLFGTRIFPIEFPLISASLDQLPFSSDQGSIEIGLDDEYERNYHHFNGSGSSSSSSLAAPFLITGLHRQWDGQFAYAASMLDAAAFMPPEYGRFNAINLTEFAVTHIDNHLVQGMNYMEQSFQLASSGAWMEQQFGNYGGNDQGTSAWNYSPTVTFLDGRSFNGGSLAIPSWGRHGYQETTNGSSVLLQSSFLPHYHQLIDGFTILDAFLIDDDMSYEELPALEEQIGSGLSREIIRKHLKTRTYVSSADAGMDGETETCIICQVEYGNQETIGMLNCGHQYHSGCIEKWILVKNECPICRKLALPVDINNG